jgi:hypothetical protein
LTFFKLRRAILNKQSDTARQCEKINTCKPTTIVLVETNSFSNLKFEDFTRPSSDSILELEVSNLELKDFNADSNLELEDFNSDSNLLRTIS